MIVMRSLNEFPKVLITSPSAVGKRSRCIMCTCVLRTILEIVVVILQLLIICQYGGDGRRLPEYQHCLSTDLQMAINCSLKANWTNITIPSFGDERPISAGLIISLTVLNLFIYYLNWCPQSTRTAVKDCISSLSPSCTNEDSMEKNNLWNMCLVLCVDIFIIIHAIIEALQLTPFGPKCQFPCALWLEISSLVLLFVSMMISMPILVMKLIKLCCKYNSKQLSGILQCSSTDLTMEKYYQYYLATFSGIKALILFTIVFCVAQVTIFIHYDNYEFELSIILIAMAVVAYLIVLLTIHFNSLTGYITIAVVGVLLSAYYIFKIYRYAALDCPVCIQRNQDLVIEHESLQNLYRICINISNATLSQEDNRSVPYKTLLYIASFNLVTAVLVLAAFIPFCCCQPGDRFTQYVKKNSAQTVHIMCHPMTEEPRCMYICSIMNCSTKILKCCSMKTKKPICSCVVEMVQNFIGFKPVTKTTSDKP